jgi:hypothetical protein
MTKQLEAPTEPIDLRRASELSGLTMRTLQVACVEGRLLARKLGGSWLTSRRDLDDYLQHRSRGRVKPLPDHYKPPEHRRQGSPS